MYVCACVHVCVIRIISRCVRACVRVCVCVVRTYVNQPVKVYLSTDYVHMVKHQLVYS